MELQYIVTKIFIDGDLKVDPERIVNIFYRWVAQQSLPGTLVDVAELLHIPAGPGVVLVGLDADYALDHSGNRWGLLYRRKAPLAGTNADRIEQSFYAAVEVARLLEEQLAGELKFSRHEFSLTINDRALASNTPETFAAAKPELDVSLRTLLGHGDFSLAPLDGDPRRRFGVMVKSVKSIAFEALVPAKT